MEIKHTSLLKIKNYAIRHVPNILQERQKKIPWPNALKCGTVMSTIFFPSDRILTICPKIQTHTAVAPSCQFPTDTTTESVFSLNTEQPKDVNGT